MWLAPVAALLIAQTDHSGHDHDHSAHGAVPDALKARQDWVDAAKAAGKV